MFHIAFLIKEARAKMTTCGNVPFIECCEPPSEEDIQAGVAPKQLVVELTTDTWTVGQNIISYIVHKYLSQHIHTLIYCFQWAIDNYNIGESFFPEY